MWFDVGYADKDAKGNIIKLAGARYGVVSSDTGGLWEMPVEIAKLAESSGHLFWDCRSGKPARVQLIRLPDGKTYLRSQANESLSDNLDNLPSCPYLPKKA